MIRCLAAAAGLSLLASGASAVTAYDSLTGGTGAGIAIGGSANYSSAVVFTSAETGMIDTVTAEFFSLDPSTTITVSIYDANGGGLLGTDSVTTGEDQSDEDAIVFMDWDTMLEMDGQYFLLVTGEEGMQIAWSSSGDPGTGTFIEDIRYRDGTEIGRSTNNYGFRIDLDDGSSSMDDPNPVVVPIPAAGLLLMSGLVGIAGLTSARRKDDQG